LSAHKEFQKASKDQWGLSYWKEIKNVQTWGREEVAEFVANMFKEKHVNEIEYKTIKTALMEAGEFTAAQARGQLSFNPVIKVRHESSDRFIAVFQPDYKERLTRKRKRKKQSLREKIDEIVLEVLSIAPSNQLPLGQIVSLIEKKYNLQRPTIYATISRSDMIERFVEPGSQTKFCRLRTTPSLTFSQVESIVDAHRKSEALRAVSKLTIDDVDIGLFLLGRLFETTLKNYLEQVEKSGTIPVTPNNYSKLNNMIQWVKSNRIVTDESILHVLRTERNNRAHDAPPSLEERKIMLRNSAFIARSYLDYIVFFEKKLQLLLKKHP
jgi:hypothetical protein